MGAYENPRFFNAPNYMAGTQAFLTTFKKGFEEEFQKGQDLIADRKEYEDGIYQKGEELKNELDAALGNSAQSKAQIQSALKSFYDEALAVDVPTKKGLGGLFVKAQEKRLGKLDLIEAQNSFTDSVAGVNTAFNYVYDPEVDINENEDKGHEFYLEKKAIYDAIKAGKHNLKFDYAGGKFNSSINVINPNTGKMEEYTPDKIQAIFTASGKEQRDIIDGKKTEFDGNLKNQVNTELQNQIAKGKYNNDSVLTNFETEGLRITREMLGTTNLNKTAMPSNETMSFVNDMYNNHANNVSTTKQLKLMREQLINSGITEEQISDRQLMEILQEPMLKGEGHYANKFKGINSSDLNKSLIFGKTRIVEESFMNDLRSSGIFNKAFRQVATSTDGGNNGDGVDANAQLAYDNIRKTINMDYGRKFEDVVRHFEGRTIGNATILGVKRVEGPEFSGDDQTVMSELGKPTGPRANNRLIFTVTSGTAGKEELPPINMNSVDGRNDLTRKLIEASGYTGAFRNDLLSLAEIDYDKEFRMKDNKKETPKTTAELIKLYSVDNYSAPSTPIPFTNN